MNSSKELDRGCGSRGPRRFPPGAWADRDRVLFDALPYQARWSTTGDAPSTEYPTDPDDPWRPLFTVPGEPPTN